VTLLGEEGWQEACAQIGVALPWTTRRANLHLGGFDLQGSIGRRVKIGSAIFEITDQCEGCERMDQAQKGLQATLKGNWRGGVTCRVIQEGKIAVGDPVQWVAE
jgi:MOSC domain-containing protein YiiM